MAKNFPLYTELNEWHKALHTGIVTRHEDLHIFRYEDVIQNLLSESPYYKDTFFHITFATSMNASLQVNDKLYECRGEGLLFFISPEQLIHWQRPDDGWKGFVLLMKPKFLSYSIHGSLLLKELVLFQQENIHLTKVRKGDSEMIARLFENILEEYLQDRDMKFEMIRSYIKIILILAQRINKQQEASGTLSRKKELVYNFQQLVNQYFTQQRSVDEYARKLNINATYLNATVKKETGKTAATLIKERILLEAKCLLSYTQLDVSEIAFELQFDEPSNFMRFFKTNTRQTPTEYRRQLQK